MPGWPFSWWGHHICRPLREFHSSTGMDRSSASYVPPWHGPSYACLQISRWLPLALGVRLVDHLCPRPRHRYLPRGGPGVSPGNEKPQYPPKLEGCNLRWLLQMARIFSSTVPSVSLGTPNTLTDPLRPCCSVSSALIFRSWSLEWAYQYFGLSQQADVGDGCLLAWADWWHLTWA